MTTDVVSRQFKKTNGWDELNFGDLRYFRSPDKSKIAYANRGRVYKFTWKRLGREGPNYDESTEDYVGRRLNGSGTKTEVKALVTILDSLTYLYGRKK